MVLLLNSVAHLLVDGLCAAVLFGTELTPEMQVFCISLYNTLAFSTQCFVGLAVDHWKKHIYVECISILLVILGYLLPLPMPARICLTGLGNSGFHVAGGTLTLLESGGKAKKLGVFVAPGCVGLTLGTFWPQYCKAFAALLLMCVIGLYTMRMRCTALEKQEISTKKQVTTGALVPILLTCAVAVRAIGGSVADFPWKTTGWMALLLSASVFLGKVAGGYICDKFGAKLSTAVTMPLSAILIAFFPQFMLPSLLGQFAVNITMPVTLWLLYQSMPDSPGFSFGLAAAVLWPGSLMGQIIQTSGALVKTVIVICFSFGLYSILYSEKHMKGDSL